MKNKFDRKEALTCVAMDLFAERGFTDVTIKDVAAVAGVNPALIYYYFTDKTDLFRATLVQAVWEAHKNYMELRSKHEDPMNRINAWFDTNVQLSEPIRKLVKMMLDYSGSNIQFPGIDAVIKEFYELERKILAESIRVGINQGLFENTDPDKLAAFVSIHLDGIMVASMIRDEFDIAKEMYELKQTLWYLLGTEKPGHASDTTPEFANIALAREAGK